MGAPTRRVYAAGTPVISKHRSCIVSDSSDKVVHFAGKN